MLGNLHIFVYLTLLLGTTPQTNTPSAPSPQPPPARRAPKIGDDSGTVQCFEMKRGEAQTSFSFRFDDGAARGVIGAGGGNLVTAVAMGGTTGGAGGGDRVFVTQVGRYSGRCAAHKRSCASYATG